MKLWQLWTACNLRSFKYLFSIIHRTRGHALSRYRDLADSPVKQTDRGARRCICNDINIYVLVNLLIHCNLTSEEKKNGKRRDMNRPKSWRGGYVGKQHLKKGKKTEHCWQRSTLYSKHKMLRWGINSTFWMPTWGKMKENWQKVAKAKTLKN